MRHEWGGADVSPVTDLLKQRRRPQNVQNVKIGKMTSADLQAYGETFVGETDRNTGGRQPSRFARAEKRSSLCPRPHGLRGAGTLSFDWKGRSGRGWAEEKIVASY